MIISILLIVLAYLRIMVTNMTVTNIYLFLSGLVFMVTTVLFLITLIRNAKIEYKKLIGFLIITDILVYSVEAVFTSSGYLADMVLEVSWLPVFLFSLRAAYTIANILLAFHLYDINKKRYIPVSLLLVLAGIFLYIEVTAEFVPYLYIVAIIVNTALKTWEKYNEDKKRLDKSN